MANYNCVIRTNYFSVTDEEKFREIIASCSAAEDKITIFEHTLKDGTKKFGFGCYSIITGIPPAEGEDDDVDHVDAFYDALQGVLCDGDAIIITEIGNEKLRYLIASCTVLTTDDIRWSNLLDDAHKLAKEMLGNDNFETKCDY